MHAITKDTVCKGRCYCGASHFETDTKPATVAYCHCADCRRVTGAPVAAFAQFPEGTVLLQGPVTNLRRGDVTRQFCNSCGSPLTAQFDYLPGQIYVAVGCLENAASFAPELHCHAEARLPWLCLTDDLPRAPTSARKALIDRSVSE